MKAIIAQLNNAKTRANTSLADTLTAIDNLTILYNKTKDQTQKTNIEILINKLRQKADRYQDKVARLDQQVKLMAQATP